MPIPLNHSGAGAITLKAPASGTVTFTLPSADGTNGQVMQTNGSGTLSFATPATGTVTSVTGTAPVVSSGGATPAISMAAATASVNGYLTSTDWTTFNNKTGTGKAFILSMVFGG